MLVGVRNEQLMWTFDVVLEICLLSQGFNSKRYTWQYTNNEWSTQYDRQPYEHKTDQQELRSWTDIKSPPSWRRWHRSSHRQISLDVSESLKYFPLSLTTIFCWKGRCSSIKRPSMILTSSNVEVWLIVIMCIWKWIGFIFSLRFAYLELLCTNGGSLYLKKFVRENNYQSSISNYQSNFFLELPCA